MFVRSIETKTRRYFQFLHLPPIFFDRDVLSIKFEVYSDFLARAISIFVSCVDQSGAYRLDIIALELMHGINVRFALGGVGKVYF